MKAQQQILRQQALLAAINRVFERAITCETADELRRTCVLVAMELTESQGGLFSEVIDGELAGDVTVSGLHGTQRLSGSAALQRHMMETLADAGLDSDAIARGRSILKNQAPGRFSERLPGDHPPVAAFLAVPLRRRRRTVGVIVVSDRPNGFEREQQEDIEALAPAIEEALYRRSTEDALRESERRLSVLMANLPGMAYRCEAGGDFTPEFLSEGCLALTGYRPEELMGERRYQDLMHPDDDERIRGTMRAALSSGRPYSHRYRIIRQDGREAHVWEQGRVVPGEDGQPRIEGLVLDITEQVLAQQEVARQMDELQRWQQVMLAREGRVRELKHQVNALYAERGLPPPYPSQEAAPGGDQEHPNQG